MIRILNGDLLEAEEDMICHQVNCKAKMNSGIAKQIREKYPKAYVDYMNVFTFGNSNKRILGTVRSSLVEESPSKYVAHMFSQFNYGYDGKRYTSYDAIYECLETVKNTAQKHGLSVALPYNIGCDRGGANWEIVYKMIQEIFSDYNVTIYKMEASKWTK